MESLGSILGGGALKLEATHLRQIPIPTLSNSQKQSLRSEVCKALKGHCTWEGFQQHRVKIDQIILSALTQRKVHRNEAKLTVEKFANIINELRAKRRWKSGI